MTPRQLQRLVGKLYRRKDNGALYLIYAFEPKGFGHSRFAVYELKSGSLLTTLAQYVLDREYVEIL